MASATIVVKTNLKRVTGYLDSELFEKFTKLSEVESRSQSQMIAHLIKLAVKQAEDEGKI